jgi:hypothetical protein
MPYQPHSVGDVRPLQKECLAHNNLSCMSAALFPQIMNRTGILFIVLDPMAV